MFKIGDKVSFSFINIFKERNNGTGIIRAIEKYDEEVLLMLPNNDMRDVKSKFCKLINTNKYFNIKTLDRLFKNGN